jgi:hypothetical protein
MLRGHSADLILITLGGLSFLAACCGWSYFFCRQNWLTRWHVFLCTVFLSTLLILGLQVHRSYPTLTLILLSFAMLGAFFGGEIGDRRKRLDGGKLMKALDRSELVRTIRDRFP